MVAKLQDVAKKAGVSVTTVSRVINGYPSLSKKTIAKVRQAMRELHYQPNPLARAIQGKASKFIGLIFPTLTNPFYAELVNELEYQLFLKGYKTIIASSTRSQAMEQDYLNMLVANQVDGIISGTHNLKIEAYHSVDAPIVSFDRYLADGIPIISSDNYQGGQLAAQYLADHGAGHVAMIVDEDTSVSPTLNRLQGASDFLSHHHVAYTPLNRSAVDFSHALPDKFDAVLASNDSDALVLLRLAAEAGKRVNDDFLVTGYDGSALVRRIAPQLATVIQPTKKLAQALINTLLKQIQAGNSQVKSPKPLPVDFHDPFKSGNE